MISGTTDCQAAYLLKIIIYNFGAYNILTPEIMTIQSILVLKVTSGNWVVWD